MEKFENIFFNILSKKAGFFMRNYESNFSSKEKWIGILELDEVIVGVIVTKDSEEDINNLEAHEYLQGAFKKPHILNSVIIASGDYIEIEKNYNNRRLVFSLKERKIIYCDEGAKALVPIIDYMVKSDTSEKVSIKEYKLTYFLMTVNILIYIISMIISRNIFDIDAYTLIHLGAKVNELINEGQVWRLITSAFLHGGLTHILFNMFALKIVGTQVEKIYGIKKYAIIYFTSALGGSLLSYLFAPNSISVGASGAIFGLLGAMLVFAFKEKENIGKQFMNNILQVIILNIVIGLTVSNIDNYGHLGGLIVGVIMSFLLFKKKVICS
ncbi:rhomboid family intramembrane serine protease [Clostridium sp.]|uniref:rhomboid family intramembrane serine protease n=1 Tax=Clostridium sp. TaxID=1506 RepID=UPI003F2F5D7B